MGAGARAWLTALLILALAGCGQGSTWRGIIKVAVVAPYSGPVTSPGLSMLAGARLAADEVNRLGGVAGYRVEVIAPDESNASSPADVAADPAVVAVVGQLLPTASRAERVYRQAGLVWLATEPTPVGTGVLPMVASPSAIERIIGRYVRSLAGHEPVAATVDDCKVEAAVVALLRASGIKTLCGAMPWQVAALVQQLPPGERFLCAAAWCDAAEPTTWSNGATIDYLVDGGAAGPDVARLAARPWPAVRVRRAEALGYAGVRLVVAAARRAAARGRLDRATVERALRSSVQRGVLATAVPAGREGAAPRIRSSTGSFPGSVIIQTEG